MRNIVNLLDFSGSFTSAEAKNKESCMSTSILKFEEVNQLEIPSFMWIVFVTK